jgi:serine/threonine-protein kinase
LTDNRQTYFVRDYIDGKDLDNIVSHVDTISINKVLEWAIALCDVLQYLHNNDIIFCDVKPANIIIDTNDQVHLIDFDIAVNFASASHYSAYGTEGYAAPEQYKGQATPQSDIYSLGATLHHALTRQDPRQNPPFSFFMRPIHAFNDDVPVGLIKTIEQAVEVNPAHRFRTCAEMKHALANTQQNISHDK